MKSRLSISNEKGVALPLALFALVVLSGVLLTFLSMGGMEPQIASNLSSTAQARFAADAGIEAAFDQLALAPAAGQGSWTALLVGPDGNQGTPDDQQPSNVLNLMTAATLTVPASLPAGMGTYTVTVRNDNIGPQGGYAGDRTVTGQAGEDGGGQYSDNNGIVIVASSGTYNGVTRTILVVMQRVTLPPFAGAYSVPGVQADLRFGNDKFTIDGRDYKCTDDCDDLDFSKRSYGLNSDQKNMRYGIAVQPGNQPNLSPATTYEARAESQLSASQLNKVYGKNQTNPAVDTTGKNTIAPDSGVDPTVMQNFLSSLAAFSGTTVYQSTQACPMVMTGNIGGSDSQTVKLTNGCAVNKDVDLGTRKDPKLIYFRGVDDPTSSFTGLKTVGNMQGAGILVVEDGDWRPTANFDWDGIVIVTGRYVSTIFDTGAKVTVYGATVANETIWNEGGNQNDGTYTGTYWDGYFNGTQVNLFNSQEALSLIQRKLLFRISTWREI